MSNYALSPKAAKSIQAIAQRSNEMFGRKRTNLYLKALKEQFSHLALFSAKGRKREGLGKGVRSFPEGSHTIYYRIVEDRIEIIDILHQSMDPETHL